MYLTEFLILVQIEKSKTISPAHSCEKCSIRKGSNWLEAFCTEISLSRESKTIILASKFRKNWIKNDFSDILFISILNYTC